MDEGCRGIGEERIGRQWVGMRVLIGSWLCWDMFWVSFYKLRTEAVLLGDASQRILYQPKLKS
jgi:hypothetical protein